MRPRFEAKTKRVLSLVLTLAVILCSIALVPVRATSANGGGTPFYIGWGSPAIPMYENKYVDLKKTAVQFEKNGDFVNGNDIEWSLDAQETAGSTDIILDNSNKTLMAFSSGRYVLNATSANKSARIYVLVNKQGNEEFVLESLDFRTQNFNADKWYSGRNSQHVDNYYISGCAYKYQSKPWYTVTGSRLYVGGANGSTEPLDYGNPIVMYDSDILNDFADYTISTKVVLENTQGDDISSRPNFSIVARGNINKADRTEGENVLGTESPSLFLTLRSYGGLCVVAKTPSGKQELATLNHGDTLYTPSAFESDEAAVAAISQGGEYVTSKHINLTRVVEMKLSGNNIKYSLDGQVVFDSTASNNKYFRFNESNEAGMSTATTGEYSAFDNDMANLNTGKGTIGFAAGRRCISVYDFKVTLNTDTMPEMSDIYFVKNSQPAIPMYAGTVTELDDLFIQFSDGTFKTGNYLNWQLNSGSNTLVDTTNGYLIAVSEGISNYTVTSGSKTCKVYVIVNEKGNSEFVLENIDFSTEGFDNNKWYSGRHSQLIDNYYLSNSEYTYQSKPWYTAQNDKMYLGGYDAGTGPIDYNNSLVMYDSEILKDFADYTISAKVALGNTFSEDLSSRPNFSIVARGKINKADRTQGEYVLDSASPSLFLTLRGYGGLCVVAKTPAGKQELASLNHGDTLYTPSAFGSDETAITELSQGGNYVMSGHVGTVRDIEMKLSGDRIRYTLDGQVIFDSETEGNKYFRFGVGNEQGMSAATTGEYNAFNNDMANLNTGKGTIGFATGRRLVDITECKVTLNVESMPKAKDIFVVKDSQPAIPMYEETAIDFADLLIQFPDGTYTLGNNLSWQAVTAAGTMSDSTGITALTSGTAVYAVSNAQSTRNIQVIVNEKDNNEFVLENTTLGVDRMPEYKEVFIVKDSQPAIPMYVRTMAELRSLVLQFPDGTYKLASAVEWQKVSGNSTTLNVPGTYLVTAQAGMDVYTVSAAQNTRRVYVIVNEKGNDEFVLENIDFSTQGFDNNKWYSGRHSQLIDNYYLSNSEYTYQSKPWYTAQNDKMYLGGYDAGTGPIDYNNTLAMYDSEILKDFADYTISAKVALGNTNSEDLSSRPNFSIVARGKINKADRVQGTNVMDANTPALFLTIRGYGGLCMVAKTPAGKQELGSLSHGDTLYTPSAFGSDETAITELSQGGNYVMAGHVGTVRNIEMKLSGNDVRYSLDGQVVFDSEAEGNKYFRFGVGNEQGMSTATTGEYTNYNTDISAINTDKGTIGFATGRRLVNITECKVTLNVEKMPVTKERQYKQDFDEFLATQNFSEADDEFYSRLDGLVGDLKDIIYNNTDDLRSKNGVNYYVSNDGNDDADGKTPQTAWKTLAKANSYRYNAGDAVLLRRGDTWYENINAKSGVSYSAYGTGAKPRVFKAYNAMQGTWVLTDTPNIWRYEQTFTDNDISNIVFNDGAFCGQRKYSVEDMTDNLDYFISNRFAKVADTENKLYLRCEAGNPQEVFSQIDISRGGSVFYIEHRGENIAAKNLELRYGQDITFMAHGKNISFSYCVGAWTGGIVFDNETKARYGGGAGGWMSCENFSFEYCHIYEQLDSGVTPQYNGIDTETSVFKNFTTTNCLFEGCQYTLEYFHTQKAVNDNGFDNMQFNYNICLDGGRGFGTDTQERVDASAYVKSWGHENTCVNSAITHNIFDRAAALSIEIIGHNFGDSDKDVCYNSIPKLYRNMYIEPRNKEFANINRIRYKFNEDTYRLLELLGVDKDSVYIYSE